MHNSALANGKLFFDSYSGYFSAADSLVVDIGAQDVNGSLRSVCPQKFKFLGLDFQAAKGVDLVMTDPYVIPLPDESADIVVSSSCFEHSEFFWIIFLEILRILKPSGLFYLNAPSTGSFHKFPVDCWRFYPDSGQALSRWANRNGINSLLLESFTHKGGEFQDFVAIFLKDSSYENTFKNRILNSKSDFENGMSYPSYNITNPSSICQNDKKLNAINLITTGKLVVN